MKRTIAVRKRVLLQLFLQVAVGCVIEVIAFREFEDRFGTSRPDVVAKLHEPFKMCTVKIETGEKCAG